MEEASAGAVFDVGQWFVQITHAGQFVDAVTRKRFLIPQRPQLPTELGESKNTQSFLQITVASCSYTQNKLQQCLFGGGPKPPFSTRCRCVCFLFFFSPTFGCTIAAFTPAQTVQISRHNDVLFSRAE